MWQNPFLSGTKADNHDLPRKTLVRRNCQLLPRGADVARVVRALASHRAILGSVPVGRDPRGRGHHCLLSRDQRGQSSLAEPLEKVTLSLEAISQGEVGTELPAASGEDAIGRLQNSCRDTGIYLRDMAAHARMLADGDLSQELAPRSERDVLGLAWREMARRFSQAILDARSASSSVSLAAQQLTSSSNVLSNGTAQQAASVEETTASLEEMSSSITQNADHSRNLEQMAMRGAQDAEEAAGSVFKTVSAMKTISERIGIIQDIAYQTNLLALNAAIV